MKDLYEKVLKVWGREPQLGQLQEECGELIAAISRYKRKRKNSYVELAEELADVEIVLGQVKHMLFNEGVGRIIYINEKRRKIRRFRKKVEEANLNHGCQSFVEKVSKIG